jgi:hypothetical protein
VIYEDDRYDTFLTTPAGREYQAEMNRRITDAFASVLPQTRTKLRSVRPEEPS